MAFTRLPLRRAALLGVGAFLTSYLAAFALVTVVAPAVGEVTITVAESETTTVANAVVALSDPTVAGWLAHNAQFVPTSVAFRDPTTGRAALTNRNLLLAVGGPSLVLFLVVPLVLVGAGAVAARTTDVTGANADRNTGAAVAAGYLPAMVLSVFLLTTPAAGGEALSSPSAVRTVFSGIVYPLVFGGLGGWIARE